MEKKGVLYQSDFPCNGGWYFMHNYFCSKPSLDDALDFEASGI